MSIAVMPGIRRRPLDLEFERLFREHSEMLYRSAYGVLRNAADAEDVLQTLFLRLLRRGVPPELERNAKGYLYRAAVNLSLDTIRARRRHEVVDENRGLEAPAFQDDTARIEERHRRLAEALAELDPAAAEILILRYVHNYTDSEIGKVLGTTRGAIAMKLLRSRARLKKLMRDCIGDDK